jgi:hypothetical protein
MKIEKVPVEYETTYVAIDGTRWRTERQCLQYEALLNDPSPLKELSFFNGHAEPIDIFAKHRIPDFAYLVIKQPLQQYDWRVVAKIVGDINSQEASYTLPTEKGIWYNDWSNAYNGGYGFNGWCKQESVATLERKVKLYQDKIDFLKKIEQTP